MFTKSLYVCLRNPQYKVVYILNACCLVLIVFSYACCTQSILNILFVVHCLFLSNNFFVVNSLPVVYEMACWAY